MSRNELVASAGTWLSGHSPRAVEEKLDSLLLSQGVSLVGEREITFATEGPNGEMIPARTPRLLGYSVRGSVSEELAERLENFMAPAPPEAIEQWLAELSAISAKRADDEFTEELRLVAYTRRLSCYPADLVKHVLLDVTWKFFPTWHELAQNLDDLSESRQRRIDAVKMAARRATDRERPKETSPVASSEDLEGLEARRARLAEIASQVLKEMRANMGAPMKGTWK